MITIIKMMIIIIKLVLCMQTAHPALPNVIKELNARHLQRGKTCADEHILAPKSRHSHTLLNVYINWLWGDLDIFLPRINSLTPRTFFFSNNFPVDQLFCFFKDHKNTETRCHVIHLRFDILLCDTPKLTLFDP